MNMNSPFPGMDPYLEGYLWPDVHQALAAQFRRQLAPLVAPRYAVRLAVTMLTDRVPAHELGIMVPDVEVVEPSAPETAVPESEATAAIAPAPVSVPLAVPVPTRLVSVEIRDTARNTLVTSIELLSPANKRQPGSSQFLSRDELRLAAVHILEIDLIRRGTRPWPEADLPQTAYMAALIRANRPQAGIWPIDLRQPLPTLPVPLRPSDADVPLDLQAALDTVYDEAQYGLTLDYDSAPPPLSDEEAAWAARHVQQWRPS
jgi:hypothetical protein